MAKCFRYYITSLVDGCIKGSNSLHDAENFAESEEYFVVDSATGEWLQADQQRADIEAIQE